MADNLRDFDTYKIATKGIGQTVDELVKLSASQRTKFERRWFDNNFFDDGLHFRYVSRKTGKIIDISDRALINVPERAIPKASRQIRGIANLLLQLEPRPVPYPANVSAVNYPNPEHFEAMKLLAKDTAQKTGYWLEEEWYNQHLDEKLILMILLAAKHGVSYIEIWPDDKEEKIRTEVFDAFDIYLAGGMTSIYNSPYLIKAGPEFISKIKSNENFDEKQRDKIHPDNKYASSEIKEAYMRSRHGYGKGSDNSATLIQKEAFLKEYVPDRKDSAYKEMAKRAEKYDALKDKEPGDIIIRHSFVAGGVWLLDEYLDIDEYPFVDFRFEPGPIYQVPLIERFIPANKSLDVLVSRCEKFANTMISGTWLQRKGENFEITNIPGGQVLKYATIKPEQAKMASVPPFYFQLMELLEKIIEEQGASTSALGTLPTGVKSGVAIESVKATEYANLKIPTRQFKETVRRISEKMVQVASKHFIHPQTVRRMDKGEPAYFDVIGEAGLEAREGIGSPVSPGVVPIRSDQMIRIEIESGLGFTMEGKKASMQQIATFVRELAAEGFLGKKAVKVVLDKFLETFQFGPTQEFMKELDKDDMGGLSEEQLLQMKIAVAETLKDTGMVGEKKDEADIMKTKIGVIEAAKDLSGGATGGGK